MKFEFFDGRWKTRRRGTSPYCRAGDEKAPELSGGTINIADTDDYKGETPVPIL